MPKLAALRKAATHCARGHIFDKKNTYWKSSTVRECRKCRAARAMRYYHRQKRQKKLTPDAT